MTARPWAVTVTICNTCGGDWKKHLDLADSRIQDEFYLQDRAPEEVPRMAGPEDVDHLDCIAILLRRFEGPMGPPGATGPTGMSR